MFLLLLAHLGCPGQNPKSRKMVVCVCVCMISDILVDYLCCYKVFGVRVRVSI